MILIFSLFCGEETEKDGISTGKARLTYIPQNGPEVAFIWTAFEEDLLRSSAEDETGAEENKENKSQGKGEKKATSGPEAAPGKETAGNHPASFEELQPVLRDRANEMLIFPPEFGCQLSVEEIRREPSLDSGRVEIFVEYFAFCKKWPEKLTIAYHSIFPAVKTRDLYYSRSGKKKLENVPEDGVVSLEMREK